MRPPPDPWVADPDERGRGGVNPLRFDLSQQVGDELARLVDAECLCGNAAMDAEVASHLVPVVDVNRTELELEVNDALILRARESQHGVGPGHGRVGQPCA